MCSSVTIRAQTNHVGRMIRTLIGQALGVMWLKIGRTAGASERGACATSLTAPTGSFEDIAPDCLRAKAEMAFEICKRHTRSGFAQSNFAQLFDICRGERNLV